MLEHADLNVLQMGWKSGTRRKNMMALLSICVRITNGLAATVACFNRFHAHVDGSNLSAMLVVYTKAQVVIQGSKNGTAGRQA